MSVRAKRLHSVLKLAKHQEQQAADEMREAGAFLNKLAHSLDGLTQYHNEYKQQWCNLTGKKLSIRQLNQYRSFLAQINSGISQQQLQIKQARLVFDQKKQVWLEKASRCKAIAKAMENHISSDKLAEEKKQQKIQDEYSMRVRFKNRLS